MFFPHLQRRGIGDVNQRQAAGLLDRLRHLVHGVGADHDSFGAGGAQSHCGGGQQPAGAAPIAPVLQAFNLLKIDAVEHDFGRVQPAEARLYLLVDGAVIRNGGFPAHTTQQAQHFHHSFLSISDDPLTLPENRRADDALFGAGIDRLARFEPALAQRVVQPVIGHGVRQEEQEETDFQHKRLCP